MTRWGFYSSLRWWMPQMVNAHIFFYITKSFHCSSWRNFPSVLEKDQRFVPQGTFLQSSRQATKAHHILQDVSFSLMGLWLLLIFPSFWGYFPWNSWTNQHPKFSQTLCTFSSSQGFQNNNKRWRVVSIYTPRENKQLETGILKAMSSNLFYSNME